MEIINRHAMKKHNNAIYKNYNISAGEVTLAGSLDYDSATSHTVTIEVSDGTLTASDDLTVNVQDDQDPTISGNYNQCYQGDYTAKTTEMM